VSQSTSPRGQNCPTIGANNNKALEFYEIINKNICELNKKPPLLAVFYNSPPGAGWREATGRVKIKLTLFVLRLCRNPLPHGGRIAPPLVRIIIMLWNFTKLLIKIFDFCQIFIKMCTQWLRNLYLCHIVFITRRVPCVSSYLLFFMI